MAVEAEVWLLDGGCRVCGLEFSSCMYMVWPLSVYIVSVWASQVAWW